MSEIKQGMEYWVTVEADRDRLLAENRALRRQRDEAVALLRDTTLCLERVLKATPVRDADEVLARAKTALATLDGGKP